MRRALMLGLVFVSVAPLVAQGQTCLGLPSFGRAPVQLSAGLTTGGDLTTIGGGIAWGGAGPFFGVNAAFVDIDEVDESAFSVGGGVGYQISGASMSRLRSGALPQATSTRSIQWCPLAAIEYQIGPEFDFLGETLDLSALSLSAGVNLGLPIVSGGLTLIPTGGVALAYTKISADAGSFGSGSESETYGIITLGLGFLMNETFSLKPFVAIPVGLEDADSRLGISLTIGLGGSR